MRLTGKRALITGSSRGIGAEISRLFASEGALVAVNHRDSKREAAAVVRSIARAGGEAFDIQADVSDPRSVLKMYGEVERKMGGLDILVNTAGLSDGKIWNAKVGDVTLDMWRRVFAVDAFGTFLCSQGALRLMRRGSSIVNVSSTPALAGHTEGLVYASAKGAVIAMTKMLARMAAPKVRVNCMVFGSFGTRWVGWLGEKDLAALTATIPLRRLGKPREAAELALFLASAESSFITGQTVVIDGGEVMH